MHVTRGVLATYALFALVTLGGCTTYRDQLARGQRAFELNEHDRTIAILRDLEPDMKRLTVPEQAEYAYLRGMTDYRVGYRADARHWLAITKAYEDNSPGVLPADWKVRVNDALEELNGVVFTEGTQSLTTRRNGDAVKAKDDKGPKKNAPSDDGDSKGTKAVKPPPTDAPPTDTPADKPTDTPKPLDAKPADMK